MPWPKPSEARRCSSGSPSSRRTTSRKQHELMYVSSARLRTEGRWGWGPRGFCARLVCATGPAGRGEAGRPPGCSVAGGGRSVGRRPEARCG